MTAYGAYGHPLDLSFDASRFALLRRGWMLAFAHVRGGGDSGGDEVDDGHHRSHSLHAGMDVASARALRIRPQAHSDFEACARWLSESSTAPDAQPPWSQSARIAVQAHSAGGLLLGVAAREHGRTLFAAMIAHSPFVDILGAMCSSPPTRDDASSETTTASHIGALQAHERAEWGDLLGVPAVWRMWRDRLAPLAVPRAAPTPYAHTLITAAQHDSRVPVSDALKWTAAMREHALIEKGIRVSNEYAASQGTRAQSETAAATLTLCRVDEKEGGHFGASSFEARVRQTALEYAFLMHTVQGKNTVTTPLDTPRL
jgi:oligopeptidase B